MAVNGFYSYVRRNHARSARCFLGFAGAFQLIGAAILLPVTLLLDSGRFPLTSPIEYLFSYGVLLFLVQLSALMIALAGQTARFQARTGFVEADGERRARLIRIAEPLAITIGLPCPKLAILATPARNAFACGLTRRSSVVVVTSGLLDALDNEELSAVLAHQMIHIRSGDVSFLALAQAMTGLAKSLLDFPVLKPRGAVMGVASVLFPLLVFLAMFAGLFSRLGDIFTNMTRLMISSSREFIADAEAIRLCLNPSAFLSALRKVDGQSRLGDLGAVENAMLFDGPAKGREATHPTVEDRVTALVRLMGFIPDHDRPAPDAACGFGRKGMVPDGESVAVRYRPTSATTLFQRVDSGSEEDVFGRDKKAIARTEEKVFRLTKSLSFGRIKTREQYDAGRKSDRRIELIVFALALLAMPFILLG